MPVKYLPWITRDMLHAEREARFVFGDNTRRVGLGGQAASMRGEPNAIGVATLYAPGRYYRPDDPLALATVVDDLGDVALALNQGLTIYVPTDGLGTGLARLPENAPALHRLIVAFFSAAPGEPCPWKAI
ncbi:hypothetical protein ASD12_18265 [Mesorhizobium sp. Root102]|uniref:DUF7831 domain-containing protein n=1 Tax=Mesorhizobium sp. Root102 TaxID=1736422 RepID=UPI0007018EEA|nr:hypothetical protein [Mesorhizobium sp. Root102]KQU77745.1 hypothetical protein ASD12_18265 [Mesorhizobium sp. Root102]